jgi:hypothetical protein
MVRIKKYKRKATKRNATKRKATKRNATKRKATKRNATKRKATKKIYKKNYKGGGKWLNQHDPAVLDNTICPICYAEFKDTPEQAIYQTRCKHIFHNDCLLAVCNLMQWYCPICRQPLSEGDCTDVYAFKEKVLDENTFNNEPDIQKIYYYA